MQLAWRETQVHGLTVRHAVAGHGEPVILIHGLSGSALWWSRNIPALARRFRVHVVELPGFGAMSGHGRFVLNDAATWLREWMRAAHLDRAHIVGHSMGGYIGIQLAASFPDVVDRLVLVAPAGVPTGRSVAGQLIPMALAVRQARPTFFPILAYDVWRAGPFTLARAGLDLIAQDVRHAVARIAAPTLLIWGRQDPLVPPIHGATLRLRIPNSRLLFVDHAGHIPMFDRPRPFNAALLSFLAGEPVGA